VTKHEPGTGPLQFLVQDEKPVVHACNDCRHVSNASECFARCAAFGGRYAEDIRSQLMAKAIWTCPGYSPKKAPRAPLALSSAPAVKRGCLYRLLAWIWSGEQA
jgi:hypothetical protein